MNEPEILKAAKQMMTALRKLRDEAPAEWDALLSTPSGVELLNAWDRLKTSIVTTDREIATQWR